VKLDNVRLGDDRVSNEGADADSPKTPFTGEELQMKFLPDSGENALKYRKEW
jgi:hypothetical protein